MLKCSKEEEISSYKNIEFVKFSFELMMEGVLVSNTSVTTKSLICYFFSYRNTISAAAYILVEHLRREYLADTELAKAEVNTIRLKLFKIGARVVWSVRRITEL